MRWRGGHPRTCRADQQEQGRIRRHASFAASSRDARGLWRKRSLSTALYDRQTLVGQPEAIADILPDHP
jgi:hypothetical protein